MKMKYLDMVVVAVFIVALVVLYFFWGCQLDPIVTAIAAVIAGISILTMHMQNKRLKELEEQGMMR